MSIESLDDLKTALVQREAALQLLELIMKEDESTTMQMVKIKITAVISKWIDSDVVLSDESSVELLKACRDFLQSEMTLDQAKDIINQKP
jgi:hypothetical protein